MAFAGRNHTSARRTHARTHLCKRHIQLRNQELPGVLVVEDVPDTVAAQQEQLLLVARAALVNHDLGADRHDLCGCCIGEK